MNDKEKIINMKNRVAAANTQNRLANQNLAMKILKLAYQVSKDGKQRFAEIQFPEGLIRFRMQYAPPGAPPIIEVRPEIEAFSAIVEQEARKNWNNLNDKIKHDLTIEILRDVFNEYAESISEQKTDIGEVVNSSASLVSTILFITNRLVQEENPHAMPKA